MDTIWAVGPVRALVLLLAVAFTARAFQRMLKQRQEENSFAIANGCKPVKSKLPYKLPGGLDILKMQYDQLPNKKVLAFQAQFFRKLDATFSFHIFGNTGYVTTDPANVEAVCASRFSDFGLGPRRDGCLRFLGEGIFVHDDAKWKHSRLLLGKQFARVNAANLAVILEEYVEDLVTNLGRESGGVTDLQPHFFHFTLLTTTALLFGEAVTALPERDQTEFGHNFDHASEITAIRLRLADLYWTYTPKSFRDSCDSVKRFADFFVEKALAHEQAHGRQEAVKYFPFILELYEDLQDAVLVRDQLVNVLLAGRDTTACTLSWAFFHLVRHPEKLRRLRDEVWTVLEGRQKVTRQDIRHMPYLKAVLDEILRLYPQIPFNVRFATCTTLLPKGGGPDGESPIMLQKGMGVGLVPYHQHRRPELFGVDAEEFRPERWMSGELDGIGAGYIPFFIGQRTCLGKDFSLTESSYAIIRILQSFPNIHLPPGTKVDPVGQERQNLTIVVSSADGCKVVLR